MKFRLLVTSNSQYTGELEMRSAGDYDCLDKAIATAKRIIDRSLVQIASEGRRGQDLFEYYCLFGDDPRIISETDVGFSSLEYAHKRCEELGGESWYLLTLLGRFAEAEPLMIEGTEKNDPFNDNAVARAEFYEKWGDSTRNSTVAEKAYRSAYNYYAAHASHATSGGEGTARMLDVNRVTGKINALLSR